MNTIVQKNIEGKSLSTGKNSKGDGPYTASSIIENNENNFTALENILDLLNFNLVLNMCILYLLLALFILFISTNVANKKMEFNIY